MCTRSEQCQLSTNVAIHPPLNVGLINRAFINPVSRGFNSPRGPHTPPSSKYNNNNNNNNNNPPSPSSHSSPPTVAKNHRLTSRAAAAAAASARRTATSRRAARPLADACRRTAAPA